MKYLNSINHYRALAIILIVAVHTRIFADLGNNALVESLILNTISGATMNFVFITGFLFYIVVYERFKYSTYIKSRVDRLLKPYLVLSILPIIIAVLNLPDYWDNTKALAILGDNIYTSRMVSVGKYLISGAHMKAYWYIPYAMATALISPWYIVFIKLKTNLQLLIFGVLLIVASLVQRPYELTNVFQCIHTLIYFTPIFLFGIICAMNKDKIYKILKGKELILLALVVVMILWDLYIGHTGLYKKDEIFSYNGFDLVIFKMIFFCLFFMVWLHRYENYHNPIINKLANISFAVFFLHVYFIRFITIIKEHYNFEFENYNVLIYLLTTIITVIVSMLVAVLIDKLLPKYSRIITGYGKLYTLQVKKHTKVMLNNVSVEEGTKTKTVLGYNCKEQIVTVNQEGVELNLVMYTTDKIVPVKNQQTIMLGEKLKGFPMHTEMQVNQEGVNMTVTTEVTEVKKEPDSDTKPDGALPEDEKNT